jgi:UDP-GlcNAc:undecaprenyl-phosphate GlcNAc-1-phosphate transferase
MNLIDGLDGLSSGVALAALAAFFVIAVDGGSSRSILPVIAVGAGGVLGFLRYNLHPASIIMGDTGAMMLGFLLAAVGISLTQSPSIGLAPYIPVIALAVPLGDMVWAIVRRRAAGAPIFVPDRRHVHHQLLTAGLSMRAVSLVLTAVGAGFGALAVVLAVGA